MNCVWFECPTPPKPDTAPVKAVGSLAVSAISSPPMPVERKVTLAVPPDSTSTIPSPILTPPPLTTPAMSIRLEAVLANSRPELITTPSMVAVPPASAVINPPEEMIALPPPLIVTSIAVPPLRTTILPPLPTMPPSSVPPERNSVLPLSITVPMARPRPKTMAPPLLLRLSTLSIGEPPELMTSSPGPSPWWRRDAAGNRNLLSAGTGGIAAFKQARYR